MPEGGSLSSLPQGQENKMDEEKAIKELSSGSWHLLGHLLRLVLSP
jgi:hypothetical protein